MSGPSRTDTSFEYAANGDLESHPGNPQGLQVGTQRGPRRVLVDPHAGPSGEVHRRRRQRGLLQRQHVLLAGAFRGQRVGADVLETERPTRSGVRGPGQPGHALLPVESSPRPSVRRTSSRVWAFSGAATTRATGSSWTRRALSMSTVPTIGCSRAPRSRPATVSGPRTPSWATSATAVNWSGKRGCPSPPIAMARRRTSRCWPRRPAQWHPDDCEWYERWQPGRKGHAVLGTYTRGGTVFTCGSTDWSHGLRGRDPMVERITRNVLDRLGK